MIKISEVLNNQDLLNYKNEWDHLLNRSNEKNIFLSWEWIVTWWKYFGNSHDLFILFAEEKNELISIAPLMFSKYNVLGINIKKVEFIGTPHSDYNGFIFTKREINVFKSYLNKIMKFSDKWDFMTLKEIPEDSKSFKFINDVLKNNKNLSQQISNICPYLILPHNYELFYASLNKKFRKNLEYRERKLSKIGDINYVSYDEFSTIKHAMNELYSLNIKRFHSMGKKALFDDNIMRGFHTELAQLFSERGWLKLGFLTLDDVPVAAEYSFGFKNKVYAYHSGFDPEYSKYGVGRLSELYHLKYLIDNGYYEYDWLRGFEPYIKDWTKSYKKNMEMRYSKRVFLLDTYKFIKKKQKYFQSFMDYLPNVVREKFRYV